MAVQHDDIRSNIRYIPSCNSWFAWLCNTKAKRFVFNLEENSKIDIIKVYAKQQE